MSGKLNSSSSSIGIAVAGLLAISALSCSNWQKAHGSVMKDKGSAAGHSIIYAALGDSTGVGVGANGGGYVSRIFARVGREHPDSRLLNLCISGSTTDDVLARQIDPAISANPTLITIGIGINDIARGRDVKQFAANYEEIVARLQKGTAAAIVVTNLPDISVAPAVPSSLRPEAHRTILLFNDTIKRIATQHQLRMVDAYAATHDLISSHPEFFSSDGFHPSDIGYEYWAKLMWPTVNEAIENRPGSPGLL